MNARTTCIYILPLRGSSDNLQPTFRRPLYLAYARARTILRLTELCFCPIKCMYSPTPSTASLCFRLSRWTERSGGTKLTRSTDQNFDGWATETSHTRPPRYWLHVLLLVYSSVLQETSDKKLGRHDLGT
jgi:hypothetical protein